jgi:hypothetical protein
MLCLTYVAAFRSGAARARPLNYAACLSRRANTILIAQGAELLGRYDSDARTTGVVPLDNCQGHRPPSFGPGTVTPSQLSAGPWGRPECPESGQPGAMSELGQIRSFGRVASMSGLRESGHGWAIV